MLPSMLRITLSSSDAEASSLFYIKSGALVIVGFRFKETKKQKPVALAKPRWLSYYQAILNGGRVTRFNFSWQINRLISAERRLSQRLRPCCLNPDLPAQSLAARAVWKL